MQAVARGKTLHACVESWIAPLYPRKQVRVWSAFVSWREKMIRCALSPS